jgi:DNA-directed RNA polymerase subunit M/transcription elongation factor TFIIS
MAPKLTYGLLLTSKGEVKKAKLCSSTESLTLSTIQTILKKKEAPACIGSYVYDKYSLHIFAYTKGKDGTENKHELPPPLGDTTLFGDILLVASRKDTPWGNPITFTSDQYEMFYNEQFENGDDVADSSDSDESSDDSEEEEESVEAEVKKEADVKESSAKVSEEYEEEEELEEEEDEDEDEEEDGYEEEEEYEKPIVKKREPKKKAVKVSISHGHNTGRAKQQHLYEAKKIQSIDYTLGSARPIPTDGSKESLFRKKIIQRMSNYVLPSTMKSSDIESIIFDIACRDASQKNVIIHFENPLFQILYESSARRIIANMSSDSYVKNTHLYKKLENADLTLDMLRMMNVMEYAPHLYSELRERQLLREQNQLEGSKAMATDLFKCGRCHKRETTFYELQTRSADEPMTKFITCLNCANHWRM